MVSMFGRETPVELELDQVEVLDLIRFAGRDPRRNSGRGVGPAKDGLAVRHHIYDLGGATPWHRRLLVM